MRRSSESKPTVAERLAAGELTEAQAYELTREAALNSLDRAMQSERGLEAKLLRRGFPTEVVASVLERLIAVGLLNDADYAHALVRTQFDKGLARRGIKLELARKGIESGVADEALAQIGGVAEVEMADCLAVKVLSRSGGAAPEVRMRRAFGSLCRKGYSPATATAAIAKAMAAEMLN